MKHIFQAYEKFGIRHVLRRGIEYLLLQTWPTESLYWSLAPKYYQWRYSGQLRRYDESLQAFERQYIDPQYVQRITPRGGPGDGTLNDIGTIISGDWDQQHCEPDEQSLFYADRIDNTLLYQAIEARYSLEWDWEETDFYRTVISMVERGETKWHGCDSPEDVDQKCRYVDKLYEAIKQNGYKTQTELRGGPASMDKPFGYMNEYLMEVAVDITRDGEPLLVDGRHRLYLAQMLGLDRIPVTIITRHNEWIETVSSTDLSETKLIEQVN